MIQGSSSTYYADPAEEHSIGGCVRKRLWNKHGSAKKDMDVISVSSKCLPFVQEPKLEVDLTKGLETPTFRFDFAFDETASNEVFCRFIARPLVHRILQAEEPVWHVASSGRRPFWGSPEAPWGCPGSEEREEPLV